MVNNNLIIDNNFHLIPKLIKEPTIIPLSARIKFKFTRYSCYLNKWIGLNYYNLSSFLSLIIKLFVLMYTSPEATPMKNPIVTNPASLFNKFINKMNPTIG